MFKTGQTWFELRYYLRTNMKVHYIEDNSVCNDVKAQLRCLLP